VIVATTPVGAGGHQATGSISSTYGSFGSATAGLDLAYGGKNWGNFVELDGLNSGRFLDPPEFAVFHDKGNERNAFDRVDYSLSSADSVHLDLNYSRSWFQNPNSYDDLNVRNVVSGGRRARPRFLETSAIPTSTPRSAPSTLRRRIRGVVSNNSVFNLGAFIRKDLYHYYPSGNPLADLGPANLQTSSSSRTARLPMPGSLRLFLCAEGTTTSRPARSTNKRSCAKMTVLAWWMRPITRPASTPAVLRCRVTSSLSPCPGGAVRQNRLFLPVLAPYDLTRGRSFYDYFGHADVKEMALYVEDQIKAATGSSIWESAATCTTASPPPARPSRA